VKVRLLERRRLVAAECWWCQVGVPQLSRVGTDPLGCCFECCVFACGRHAEWDTGDGKWLCVESAAEALAAGAGLPEVSTTTTIRSLEDFERRLPLIWGATAEHRGYYRHGEGEGWLGHARDRLGLTEVDFFLLADALGVGRFVEESQQERVLGVTRVVPPPVVAGLLGQLVRESL
jgi:hypothetical protein